MRIRIIRPTGSVFFQDGNEPRERAREWKALASPDTELDIVRVDKGVETIESDYDVGMATPWIIREVERAEQAGFDAAVILCMGDPGLQGAREGTHMPVIGAGQACYLTALALGDRFSIIAIGNADSGFYRRCLRKYGLEQHLASVRCLGFRVHELRNDLEALARAFRHAAAVAVEQDGAEVIIPGCTNMYGITEEAQAALGVPVLDPVATVIKFAEMLVALGVSHSKRAFPNPLPKRRLV